MLIYLATNKINGKKYVGYTTLTLEERIKNHIRKSRSQKEYFYLFKNALRKYGEDSFSWSILEYCKSVEECCEREIHYIKELNTLSPNGYNLTEGGNGGIQSQEVKDKISASLKKYYKQCGHPLSNLTADQRKERTRKAWITKKKNGYVHKGSPVSKESRKKMSNSKNSKNALEWINDITGEVQIKSCTDMGRYTGLSTGAFNHIKNGRKLRTKTGWRIRLDL